MGVHGVVIFTTEKKRKKELTSVEIRKALVKALEDALTGSLQIATARNAICKDGFVSLETLQHYMNFVVQQYEKEETLEFQAEKGNKEAVVEFSRDFKISDSINKGIAVWLDRIKDKKDKDKNKGKELIKVRNGRKFLYKGYEGITKDFERSLTEGSLAAIESFTYDFIKGALDFTTIAKIRNEIKQTEIKEDMKAPEYAFICFENPYYEFSKDANVENLLLKEREDILAFAKAIVRRKVVKIQYSPLNHENDDTIILHPHYIRRVGRKYMIYGFGHKAGKPHNARILNIILSRVKSVKEIDGVYKTAAESKVDYNYDFFKNVIIYDASRDDVDRENPTRVVLKVVRERKAAISGKILRPLARLMEEPLHQTMRAIVKNNTIDEKYGYVEMYVSDYMYLKRILLPWGADITVESPAELRQLMQDEAKRLMEAYAQESEEAEYSVTQAPQEKKEDEGATLEGMA